MSNFEHEQDRLHNEAVFYIDELKRTITKMEVRLEAVDWRSRRGGSLLMGDRSALIPQATALADAIQQLQLMVDTLHILRDDGWTGKD